MQPQAPLQPEYSIDYLNQIASTPHKQPVNKTMVFLVFGGALFVIILFIFALIAHSGSGPTTNMEILSARLQTLQSISTAANTSIKSDALLSINSNLSTSLTTANAESVTPLKNNGINPHQLPKAITSANNGAKLTSELQNAQLNAVYDETYAREMTYQLTTLISLMKEIYHSTSSRSMKAFLQTTDTNIQPLETDLANFNDSTSN